jgi:hypothetical protein
LFGIIAYQADMSILPACKNVFPDFPLCSRYNLILKKFMTRYCRFFQSDPIYKKPIAFSRENSRPKVGPFIAVDNYKILLHRVMSMHLKDIISTLMLSDFYFCLPLWERKQVVLRLWAMYGKKPPQLSQRPYPVIAQPATQLLKRP